MSEGKQRKDWKLTLRQIAEEMEQEREAIEEELEEAQEEAAALANEVEGLHEQVDDLVLGETDNCRRCDQPRVLNKHGYCSQACENGLVEMPYQKRPEEVEFAKIVTPVVQGALLRVMEGQELSEGEV